MLFPSVKLASVPAVSDWPAFASFYFIDVKDLHLNFMLLFFEFAECYVLRWIYIYIAQRIRCAKLVKSLWTP